MDNNTVFVLLAGGRSQRMGVAKGLLNYQDSFWILEQLTRIANAGIKVAYIGLGHNSQLYFDAIPWFKEALHGYVNYQGLKVRVIVNPEPASGSFSTLQSVFRRLDVNGNVLVNPVDVPILNATELKKIITTDNTVVFPSYKQKKGHPIKLAADFWQPLALLATTDDDARLDFQVKKITKAEISNVNVSDDAVVKNLNTPEQWTAFLTE